MSPPGPSESGQKQVMTTSYQGTGEGTGSGRNTNFTRELAVIDPNLD